MDGLLIVGQSDQSAAIEEAAKSYEPMVVWGQWLPGQGYTTVGVDNVTGGRLAAEHLVSRGRTRLAFFGNTAVPEFAARYEGFLTMLAPDIHEAHALVPIHLTSKDSYDAAVEYLTSHPTTDGIFAASDVVAMSVVRAAVDCGRRVPEDISVVGFDDVPLAAQSNPPLTTISQDLEQGSNLMCDILFDRMNGKRSTSVRLTPELIVRASS
jgi:DNA-binding LacI/PurR family transcriptional regulator